MVLSIANRAPSRRRPLLRGGERRPQTARGARCTMHSGITVHCLPATRPFRYCVGGHRLSVPRLCRL